VTAHEHTHGRLIVVSGPSAVGKGSVVQLVIDRLGEDVGRVVTTTTRAPRPGEANGVDYHFTSREEFDAKRAEGEFVEAIEYAGQLYGTTHGEIQRARRGGRAVIIILDVDGALNVRRAFPDAELIFLLPPSWQELVRRIEGRGTESESLRATRLARAREELALAAHYDYWVVNDQLEDAASRLIDLIGVEG